MSAAISSSNSRISWSSRADLKIVPLEFTGQRSWGIKDPITLAYFELRDEENFVLQQLDGRATVDAICLAFQERFRPRTLSPQELRQFVSQLIAQGLVVAEGAGYGRMLVARDKQMRSRRLWARLANVLCIRFRGIDPDQLFERLLPWVGWIFSPVAVIASLFLIGWALILVTVQFEHLVERLPDARALLSAQNLMWLPILLAAVKVLHEFGHGLACKRFGGECRELGAMLLLFTPTLYCNVSDSWMVADKWKRIAVSAAGMWVEVTIAACCTLLWWFSTPGLFHSLCLNLMFICGVSTLLFNGNPLLRYDGYFILSDWLEVPNLQQQSMQAIRSGLGWWYCGIHDSPFDRSVVRRWPLLFSYGVVSYAYRILLSFLILWSLYHWMQPFGLAPAVQVLAVPMIGMMLAQPILSTARFFRDPTTRQHVNWSQFRFRTTVTGVLLALLFTIPLPTRVRAGALLDQGEAQRVYSTLGGSLVECAKVGDTVAAGDLIARLSDWKVQAELNRLEGECDLHRQRVEQLEVRRIVEPDSAALIPATREALRDFESQLAQLRETADRLVLRAPCDGTVLPASWQSGQSFPGALPAWSGSPLDEQNGDCFIKPGTTICLVGSRESRDAVLLVNQDDINLVKVGQAVRIAWRELAGEILTGQITEVAALDMDSFPREAASRLNLPVRTTVDGKIVPVGTWYRVRVHLDATESPLLRNAAGEAKIVVEPQSLGRRFLRWLSRTFAI